MKLKRIVCFVFIVIMVFSNIGCSSCSKNDLNDGSYSSGVFYEVSDNKMSLYQQIELTVLKGVVSDQVEFTSSNNSVLDVDGNSLFAVGVGDATISAKYGDFIQTQTISVVDNGERPIINTQDIGMVNGTTFDLVHKVGWGDKFFDGATFTYSIDRADLVEIKGQTLSAKAFGVVKISVVANYKGKQIAESEFNCSVIANEGVVLDRSSYDLYITQNVKGFAFDKQLDLQARVYENGEYVENASVSFEIENSNIATIQNGVIIAKALGTTNLIATYVNGDKILKTKKIPVTVSVPIIDDKTDVIIDKGLNFQTFDGMKIFGTDDNVGKIVNNNDRSEISVTNNGVNTALFDKGEYSFTIYNQSNTIANSVNLVVAEYVVYDKEDLLNIAADQNIDKYIAIANDIDFEGGIYTNANSNPGSSVSAFTGTLNGLGHTIKNISFVYASEGYKGQNYLGYSGGLFSYAGDCTFKNLCMENVELFGWNSAPLFYRSSGVVNVDNVYIHSTFTSTAMRSAGGLFAFCFSGQVSVSNSIIISENLTMSEQVKLNNGAICARLNGVFSVKNVYIISDGDICSKQSDYHNKPEAANSLSILYSDFEEFETERINGNINVSDFNHYWDLSKNIPTFKTNR